MFTRFIRPKSEVEANLQSGGWARFRPRPASPENIVEGNLKFSAHGTPRWFSPQHAGEKLKEISLGLATILAQGGKSISKSLADKLWAIQERAHGNAIHYFKRSPVQSVRVMEPTGAIFVILADGREVLVPQPPPKRKELPEATQQEKNNALRFVLYDMYVLAASLRFLKSWRKPARDQHFGEEQMALAAVLLKTRALDSFLHSHGPIRPNTLTTKAFGVDGKHEQRPDERAFRESINQFGAHLTWERGDLNPDKPARPKRREAGRVGSAILAEALAFIEDRQKHGYHLDKQSKRYLKEVRNLRKTL